MRIAIIGAGISGLTAARHLHREHEITVFEADRRTGGHTHTWNVTSGGEQFAVDSGFIVYNERNYPNFTRMLSELGVATQPTSMSFSLRHDIDRVEYNGSTLRQLFVQPRNALRPPFIAMLRDILRFNRDAVAHIAAAPMSSIGDFLEEGAYSSAFRDWYLLPMASALWSIPHYAVREMPARYVISFFDNHGMLGINGRPAWRVVSGGSARYVDAMTRPFLDRIIAGRKVHRVERFPDHVTVDGIAFDRVVFACHSDQALATLSHPSRAEQAVLSALPYQRNHALLHTDTSVLPQSPRAWGAWNYRVRRGSTNSAATVTYNMNALQSLSSKATFCVTLNDRSGIDPRSIIGETTYHHPVATIAGENARARRAEISGVNRTHYCGAYWGNGFHEAGVVSGIAVADEIEAAARCTAPVKAFA